jgi:hypothetical protein
MDCRVEPGNDEREVAECVGDVSEQVGEREGYSGPKFGGGTRRCDAAS